MARQARPDVDLLRLAQLLQAHITPALCRAAFGRVRKTERQRVWTLTALVQFWVAVILRAPKALSQALADGLEVREPLFPRVPATPEAFFQRCRDLRPAFFVEVFERFTARVLTAVPPRYAAEMAEVQARFAALVVFDGSRLAAIARRLKLLWDERAVVLPGCLLGRLRSRARAVSGVGLRRRRRGQRTQPRRGGPGPRSRATPWCSGTGCTARRRSSRPCMSTGVGGWCDATNSWACASCSASASAGSRAGCWRTGWSAPAPGSRPPRRPCATSAGAAGAPATRSSRTC